MLLIVSTMLIPENHLVQMDQKMGEIGKTPRARVCWKKWRLIVAREEWAPRMAKGPVVLAIGDQLSMDNCGLCQGRARTWGTNARVI